jgi:hypothetical protein
MGELFTLVLDPKVKRAAREARRLTEINIYLRECERIIEAELKRSMVNPIAMGNLFTTTQELDL